MRAKGNKGRLQKCLRVASGNPSFNVGEVYNWLRRLHLVIYVVTVDLSSVDRSSYVLPLTLGLSKRVRNARALFSSARPRLPLGESIQQQLPAKPL